MAAQAVIDARDLSLTFTTAHGARCMPWKASTLKANDGDFVSFIGPSGCGKTTLLRVIADLEQATAGTISVNGMSPAQARMARAYGYVFQAPALYPWRTVEKKCRAAAGDHGNGGCGFAGEAQSGIGEFLGGFEKKFPWQLSGAACSSGFPLRGLLQLSRSCCSWMSPSGRSMKSCATS